MVNFFYNTNTVTVSITPQCENNSCVNNTYLLCNPNSLTDDVPYNFSNPFNGNSTACNYNSNSDAFNMILFSDTLPNSLFQTCQWQFSQNISDITTYALSTGANPPQNVTINPPPSSNSNSTGNVTFTSNPYPLSFSSPTFSTTYQNPYYMVTNDTYLGISEITSTTNLCNIQPITQYGNIVGNNNTNFEISINAPYNSVVSEYSQNQTVLVISADGDNIYLNMYVAYQPNFKFQSSLNNNDYFTQYISYTPTTTFVLGITSSSITDVYVYTSGSFTTTSTFYVQFTTQSSDVNVQFYLNENPNQTGIVNYNQNVLIEYNANSSSFSIQSITLM